ncbi:hypothetical protein NIES4071_53490 [Calothrix sp. NIES-4071]|nr:hypothetical protein NIES4071_53490 [Calothrix sp. NIES-4071]BAZ59657.1 hypothetical protein NIES4105_53440 [Calothrix sp. NIES-4105]
MSSIKISNLGLVGSDLLVDSESYLEELNDAEIKYTLGGVVVSQATVTAGFLVVPEYQNERNYQQYWAPAYFNVDSYFHNITYSIKSSIIDIFST